MRPLRSRRCLLSQLLGSRLRSSIRSLSRRRGRSGILRSLTASRGLRIVAVRRRPQREVVAQELHDEGAVAVGLLGEGVELGDGVVEGLLGEVAGAVGRVEDLVVEDGEVEGETEADGVGWRELGLRDVGGALVGALVVSLRRKISSGSGHTL